jgi:hypothetical protein
MRHHDHRRRHDDPREPQRTREAFPDYEEQVDDEFGERRFDQEPFEPEREGWSVRLPDQRQLDDYLYGPAERWPTHAHSPRERDAWQPEREEHGGGQGYGPRTGRFHEPRWAPSRSQVPSQGPWDPPAYQGAYDQHRSLRDRADDQSWYDRYGHSPRVLHPGPKNYTRGDDRIRDEVCDRLWQAGGIDTSDVEVSVAKGEITLSGSVPERPMKYAIEDICDHVGGVVEIHNQLRVRRPS